VTFRTTTVFAPGQFGHHTYRIPALVATPHGLVAFVEGRRDGAGDVGEIELLARRSPDGGLTWTDPVPVASRPGFTCGNPAPVLVDEDTIVMLSCTNGATADERAIRDGLVAAELTRRVHLQRISLPDLEATSPQDITATVKSSDWGWYATGPGHAIRLRHGPYAGRLVVPADHSVIGAPASLSPYGSHLLLSDDNGETWRIGAVTSGIADCAGPNECCAAELADGEIVVTVRNEARDPDQVPRALFRSGDGGGSGVLEAQPELSMPVVQASLISAALPGGEEVLVMCAPSAPDRRARLGLRSSRDGGRTWTDPLLVDPGPSGYSDLAATADGQLHLVWESGEKSPYERIRHAVCRITDVVAC